MSSTRDRLVLGKGDRNLIEQMEKENYLNFKGKTRKEQFMYVLSVGINSGLKGQPLESGKDPWFWVKDLHPDDISILYACAIQKEKLLDIVTDIDNVYKIAEEYAHIGVKILYDSIQSAPFGTFENQLELEINDMLQSLGNIE